MNTRDFLALHPRVPMYNPHVSQAHVPIPRVPPMDSRPVTPASASMSRSYTYKKVTKPMLERRRRARISKCLDELKSLMIGPMKMTEESLNKMEKADILELVVDHLHNLQNAQLPNRYQEGFNECAAEACHFLETRGGGDITLGERLAEHLEKCTGPLSIEVPSYRLTFSPPVSPVSLGATPRSFPRQTTMQELSCTSPGLLMEANRKRSMAPLQVSVPKRMCQIPIPSTSQISPSCTSGYCSDESGTPDSSESMWRPW